MTEEHELVLSVEPARNVDRPGRPGDSPVEAEPRPGRDADLDRSQADWPPADDGGSGVTIEHGTVFDDTVYVADGILILETAEYEGIDDCYDANSSPMLGAALPGVLAISTGAQHGYILFTIEVLESAPTMDESWEDVVEASFEPAQIAVWVTNLDGDNPLQFGLEAGDTYRVRVSGKNIDAAAEQGIVEEGEPVDSYLVQFWPAPAAPDVMLRQTSTDLKAT